ncbi:TRAP transporter small permease [Fodinicurvata sp. EGI_FJ10296]|uniref:TRAP transporter small permease subunit n=1 Tax=Fodinicurvata sp. EGI_FJ10296 TaxID=3231908 RepID=UPI003453F759
MIDRALRSIDIISRVAVWLGAVFMALIAILMLSEIGTRYLAGRSLGVTWELATYSMAAVIFLGAADTLRAGGHVRVSVLLETVPPAVARAVDIVATTIGLVIVGYILMGSWDFVFNAFVRDTRSFEPTRVLLWIPQSVVVIGMALLLLQLAGRLCRLLTGRDTETGENQVDMPADHSASAEKSRGGVHL